MLSTHIFPTTNGQRHEGQFSCQTFLSSWASFLPITVYIYFWGKKKGFDLYPLSLSLILKFTIFLLEQGQKWQHPGWKHIILPGYRNSKWISHYGVLEKWKTSQGRGPMLARKDVPITCRQEWKKHTSTWTGIHLNHSHSNQVWAPLIWF